MSAAPVRPGTSRKWYGLALRHLRMAARLRRGGFLDGAIFHACHAYECAMCAFIAKGGFHIPPDGKVPSPTSSAASPPPVYVRPNNVERPANSSTHVLVREYFEDLASARTSEPFYRTYLILRPVISTDFRNRSLYYRHQGDILPAQQHSNPLTVDMRLRQVSDFVKALRAHV